LIQLGDALLNLLLDLVEHGGLLAVESWVLKSEGLNLRLVLLVLLLRLVELLLQVFNLGFLALNEFGHLVVVVGHIETLLVNLRERVAFKVTLTIKVVATTNIFNFNLFQQIGETIRTLVLVAHAVLVKHGFDLCHLLFKLVHVGLVGCCGARRGRALHMSV